MSPEADWVASEVAGGAMATQLERITAQELTVIRKWAPASEIAALGLAQQVRPAAGAIPEIIETGDDANGTWYVIPEYRGAPSTTLTASAVNSLARLHAHFYGDDSDHAEIPVIDLRWWQELCTHWVQPAVERHAARHGAAVSEQARHLVESCRTSEALTNLMFRITPTLLHGDIHPGNVLVDGDQTHLIDWGSARFGTPLLDLLNLVAPESAQLQDYLEAFAHYGPRSLEPDEIAAGRQWAMVQIPVQYLPWILEHRTTTDVASTLITIENALAEAAG